VFCFSTRKPKGVGNNSRLRQQQQLLLESILALKAASSRFTRTDNVCDGKKIAA